MSPEAVQYGDRKVYTVGAFNEGLASWVARLPSLWVEGEITELRRQPSWATVFFTLRDPEGGATIATIMPRSGFDALPFEAANGARVHVFARPEVWIARGELRLRALSIEPFGEGALLARLEQLRRRLAAEGLFAPERKRALPAIPARIGLITGSDAAARQDVIAAITQRFPPARILVAPAAVQGPRAPAEIVAAIEAVCAAGADVVILARGGGSLQDLLPFSDERLVRAVAACRVPLVSAIGHEQDTPLCDLAADVRASTPTAAGRLVVPDWHELKERLDVLRAHLRGGVLRTVARQSAALERDRLRLLRAPTVLLERGRSAVNSAGGRLSRAPVTLLERQRAQLDGLAGRLRALSPGATLERGYAIVTHEGRILRQAAAAAPGDRLEIRVAVGELGARVEEISP